MLAALLLAFPYQSPEALPLLPAGRLNERLEQLANAHRDVASSFEWGTSRAGRSMRGLELAAPGLAADAPAILLVGGLEGPRAFESAVVLHHAERLCAERPGLLERARVYALPRVAVDAAEGRWDVPRREVYATGRAFDNDRDGLVGEDPPADVDGDGVVAWMRVPHPEGTLLPDPHDGRANTTADAKLGQRGRFRVVPEGYDSDGDERASEDGVNDARTDRSFPAGWNEHAPEAGRFPLEEPEARALADFVIGHPNLVLVVCYGDADNLAAEPKAAPSGSGRVPAPGWMESDAEWLGALGEAWRDARDEDALPAPALHAPEPGSFASWAYAHRGLWVVAARLWELPEEAPKARAESGDPEPADGAEPEPAEPESAEPESAESGSEDVGRTEDNSSEDAPPGEPSEEAKHLEWIDAADEQARFLPWRPFEHPDLGPVEIGGFAPFAHHDPPLGEREAIANDRFDFFVGLDTWLPRLALDVPEVTELGTGLWELRAVIRNEGRLPTTSAAGDRTRRRPRIVLELSLPEGASLVSGKARYAYGGLDGEGGRREEVWWIAAPDLRGARLTVSNPCLGSVSREVSR